MCTAIMFMKSFLFLCLCVQIILINFRKEILAFMPKKEGASTPVEDTPDDCSDVLVVSNSIAIAAHNEDANVALVGHTYVCTACSIQ